jgi:hypothetical protein
VSSSQNLIVTWSPSGSDDVLDWEITGNCIATSSWQIFGDPGSVTIPSHQLSPRGPNMCGVTLSIEKTHYGELDPAFANGNRGRARATWRAEVTFKLVP